MEGRRASGASPVSPLLAFFRASLRIPARPLLFQLRLVLLGSCGVALLAAAQPQVPRPLRARPLTWDDAAPVRSRLQRDGVTAATFGAFRARLHDDNVRRVQDGDRDHLVFYLLQSKEFTDAGSVEPALSARAFVGSLEPHARESFLAGSDVPGAALPREVSARLRAFEKSLDEGRTGARLDYFEPIVKALPDGAPARAEALAREYRRVMRFVYEKEFVAQKAPNPGAAVADLYRTRGLATDTAVEAGFLVSYGLGIVKSLDPGRRVRRVLIVGPGLDLAPRTALLDAAAPESYQPWAVIDALVALGLSRLDDLEVVAADINPRVVAHLRERASRPPVLTVISGIGETAGVTFSADYREYFAALGRAIGRDTAGLPRGQAPRGHLAKTIAVGADAGRALHAVALDLATETLDGAPFDLAIATNILPYFDEPSLALAMSSLAAMLAPGGVLLHNEARPSLREVADAAGLPFEQARHAVIAAVSGAPAPLFDSVFLHRRAPAR